MPIILEEVKRILSEDIPVAILALVALLVFGLEFVGK